jgi:NitT/TauT family transport system permease protein
MASAADLAPAAAAVAGSRPLGRWRPGPRLWSFLALLAAWGLGAALAGDPTTFPGPLRVAAVLAAEAWSGALWLHLGATLARVAAAFILAIGIGALIGVAMGRSRAADAALDAWLVAFLNLPALVAIALCYIWIGLNETAAIVAVAINKIPLAAAMMREGARALDPALDDMARAYRMGWTDRMRHVVAPQLAPHVAATARAGLALVWKIVLVVEFLGRPNGVGFMIHMNFQLFDVARVLAYAVAFIAVMLAVEALVLRPWERAAARWRAP